MATTSEECTMFLFSWIHSPFHKRTSNILQLNFSVRCAIIRAEAAPTLKLAASGGEDRVRTGSTLSSREGQCRARWPAGHSCKGAPGGALLLGGFSIFS